MSTEQTDEHDGLRVQIEADVLECVRGWTQIDGRIVLRRTEVEEFRTQLIDATWGRES